MLPAAWAVVNENSGPGSQAIIDGIPAFVGAHSMALPVANTDFAYRKATHARTSTVA